MEPIEQTIAAYALILLQAAKDLLRQGKSIKPEGILFVRYDKTRSFQAGLIPELWGINKKSSHKEIVQQAWEDLKIQSAGHDQPVTLIAVLLVMDTYIENLEDVEFTPEGKRKQAFIPKHGQREAVCISVFEKHQQFTIQSEYTVMDNQYTFGPIEKIPTLDSPGDRLRNLWPTNL